MSAISITSIAFKTARDRDVSTGLLGWVTCVVNDSLMLDGLTLRRTRDGRLTLSYPARRDAEGRQHFHVRPVNDPARRDLERQVFAKLGIEQEASP